MEPTLEVSEEDEQDWAAQPIKAAIVCRVGTSVPGQMGRPQAVKPTGLSLL